MDISPLIEALEAESEPQRAIDIRNYMKTDMDTYGVSIPFLRKSTKAFLRQQSDWNSAKSRELCKVLWNTNNWHLRQAAIEVLVADIKLHRQDAKVTLEFCEQEIMPYLDGWAFTDTLANKVLSQIIPATCHLLIWMENDSFWIRRCALLSQLARLKTQTFDFQTHQTIVYHLIPDNEWFIQKAIGWSLREIGKKHPEYVLAFCDDRPEMSNFARKEATRNLV